MDTCTRDRLIAWAEMYNDPQFFSEDPIVFPAKMAEMYRRGERSLADVEISALIAAHSMGLGAAMSGRLNLPGSRRLQLP